MRRLTSGTHLVYGARWFESSLDLGYENRSPDAERLADVDESANRRIPASSLQHIDVDRIVA